MHNDTQTLSNAQLRDITLNSPHRKDTAFLVEHWMGKFAAHVCLDEFDKAEKCARIAIAFAEHEGYGGFPGSPDFQREERKPVKMPENLFGPPPKKVQ